MNNNVLVAMSGGVDSAVTALLVKQSGFTAHGVTMCLNINESMTTESDALDAKLVADKLGISHSAVDLRTLFKKNVVDRFADEYINGSTPNPCIYCNRYLKFGALIKEADRLLCDRIATGHYARIEKSGGNYLLKKAKCLEKDQSYVLFSLNQEQLKRILFPLGEYTKDEVRSIAEDNRLVNAKKHDSQDICFVPDGDYARFICEYTGKTFKNGDFVTRDGNVLGEHKGIIKYTIGQRRGLGLALPAPLYVCEKDVVNNRVVLCSDSELYNDTLYAKDLNWTLNSPPAKEVRVLAKIRYRHQEQPATVYLEDDRARVVFDEPQRAATKGQAVVFYEGDTVLGGGIIE